MLVISFFTDEGSPKPGLSPTITIVDADTDALVVNAAAMTALTQMTHAYYYNFAAEDRDKNYVITVDGGAALNDLDRYQFATSDPGGSKEDVITIRKVSTNRWRISSVTNKKTVYDDDKTTALLEFDLKDEAGNPTVDSPAERNPV